MSHTVKKIQALVLIVTALCLIAPPSASAGIDLASSISSRELNPERTSIAVIDVQSGELIASYNPDMLLSPASCAKIFTAVSALGLLGADYRFQTDFFTQSKKLTDTIDTLYVRGTGDPSLVNEGIEQIALELYARGIRKIENGIVIDNSFFDSFDYPRKEGNAGRAYTAKTSAVAVNHNSIAVEVGPGTRAGRPGVVTLEPAVDIFRVVNRLTTARRFGVNIAMGGTNGNTFTVSGRVPLKSAPQKFWRAIPDPLSYAGAVFTTIFAEKGIVITGQTKSGTVPKGATPILRFNSVPLFAIVRDMMKLSTNFTAEQLVKHLGAAKFGTPGSTEKGVATIKAYIEKLGIPAESFELENGSGLSAKSRVSARQLVEVLSAAYRDERINHNFAKSLSILGVDGTMKRWRRLSPKLAGRVTGKTGTLNGVTSLAGFVPMKDGRMAAFAILANGIPQGAHAAQKAELRIVEKIADMTP